MKIFGKLLLLIMVSQFMNAYGGDLRYVNADRFYQAYGNTWHYKSVFHHGQKWSLFTGHGLIGRVDTLRQDITLETNDGKILRINERLYALQKDSSYKKVDCCVGSNTLGNIYALDGKMFIHFLQERRNITDCFVHPTGIPDNEKLPSEKRVRWVSFFGEFDPNNMRFNINTFSAYFDYQKIIGPDWKDWIAKASIEEHTIVEYKNRTPFICD